jgi:hypothetical protein
VTVVAEGTRGTGRDVVSGLADRESSLQVRDLHWCSDGVQWDMLI